MTAPPCLSWYSELGNPLRGMWDPPFCCASMDILMCDADSNYGMLAPRGFFDRGWRRDRGVRPVGGGIIVTPTISKLTFDKNNADSPQ